MFDGIHPALLRHFVDPQGASHPEQPECSAREEARPTDDGKEHDDVSANRTAEQTGRTTAVFVGHAMETAVTVEVVEADAPVEKRSGEHAPTAAETVDGDRVHGVIDLELQEQLGWSQVHEGADEPDSKRAASLHVAAGSRDGHQARQDAITQAADVIRFRHQVP